MSYKSICFTGWHILLDDLSYRKTRLMGGQVLLVCVLLKAMHYLRHVLQVDMSYRSTCIMKGHVLLKVMF